MPGEWVKAETSNVPDFNRDLLPEEERSADWVPPTPPKVDKSLLPFAEEFRDEVYDPPRIDVQDKEVILRRYYDLPNDEKLVLFDNECVIATTFGGVKESKRREEEDSGYRGGRGGRGGGRGGRGGGGRDSQGDRRQMDPNLEPVAAQKRKWGECMDAAPSRSFNDRDLSTSMSSKREPEGSSHRYERSSDRNERSNDKYERSFDKNERPSDRRESIDDRISRIASRKEDNDEVFTTPQRTSNKSEQRERRESYESERRDSTARVYGQGSDMVRRHDEGRRSINDYSNSTSRSITSSSITNMSTNKSSKQY